MLFRLSTSAGQPLYLQLMQQIRYAIESGALRDGDQLPGIRTLAEELVVSPGTVVRAYTELEHEGVLAMHHGAGAFVCANRRSRRLGDRVQAARERVDALILQLRDEGLHDAEIRRLFEAGLVHAFETVGEAMSTPVIETVGLSKSYGRTHAVRGLNLTVEPGRITAFLGLNGAGKSTTIKMLLGIVKPTEGDGRVLGRRIDNPAESVALRREVAYVSEDKQLYGYMTVGQIVRFTSGFFPDWRPEVASALLQRFELPAGRKIRHLSKGMRTKLALVLAVSRRPTLLILDEPSEGLDPRGIEQLLECLVARCAEGTSVFFSSHQIAEVERISDQVCVIDRGRIVLDASLDDLRQSWRRIDAVFPSAPNEGDFQLAGVERIRTRGQQVSLFASGNVEAIVERSRDLQARTIDVTAVGLREIFLQSVEE